MTLKHTRADDAFLLPNADLDRHLKFIGTTGGKEPFVFVDGKADAQMIPTIKKGLNMKATPMAVVRQKSTGLYLRMTKFDPVTQEPLYGPLEAAWIADSEPQAIAQAGFLGEDDHEPVSVTFAASDIACLAGVTPEQAQAVLSNTNTKIFLKH